MELNISEKVVERRRVLDLTQDELAHRIGVSAQAVSNWERRAGYPDVTILPSLAGALGISTDELLGIGRLTDKEILEQFKEQMRSLTDPSEIKACIFENYHAYPNNYFIMGWIIWIIYREFREDAVLIQLAKEMGHRILKECTDTEIRFNARKVLAFICDDDEAAEYIDTFYDQVLIRPNIIGRRMRDRGAVSEANDWFDLEMVLLFQYIIGRASYCDGAPEKAVVRSELMSDLMKTVGGGDVPEGWLEFYGNNLMRHSAALFAVGDKEKGYEKLEEALSAYEKWYSYSNGEKLPTGRLSLFGNVNIVRSDKGSSVYVGDELYPHCEVWENHISVPLRTDFAWGWFDSVRDEERFTDIVRKAAELEKR